MRLCQLLRLPSPLIEPDVRISRIRLSDWLHRKAHGVGASRSVHTRPARGVFALRHSPFGRILPSTVLRALRPITLASSSSRAYQKSGSFPRPELPGFSGTMALSDSRRSRRPKSASRPLPSPRRGSPVCPHHLSDVPCPIPRWTATGASAGYLPVARGLPRSIGGSASTTSLSRPAQASLALRPAGLLSRPMATFVTRLRPGQLPNRTACQLPELPTSLRVDSSSTGVTRRRGALWIAVVVG